MTKVDVTFLYLETQNHGLVMVLFNAFGKGINISLPLGEKFLQNSIGILDLSVRSQNCLTRRNVKTIDDLVETIAKPDGLTSMRGLGQKSINEIKTKLMVCAYDNLSDRQKLEFLQDMVEKNKQ